MRVGPWGLLQAIADPIKLLLKEDIVPAEADKAMFLIAPVIGVIAAFTAFSVIPFTEHFFISDLNIGILFALAVSSLGIYGIILGGWASNSHYPLLGALRSSAQLVSYEVAAGIAIVSVVLLSHSLSMVEIVKHQQEAGVWNVLLQPVGFFVYLVAAIAETNRSPFDLPEAESELTAGFHTEYSGFRWALYFLAEYANIFVVSSVAVTLFWGGWLRPFPNVAWLEFPVNTIFPTLLFIGSGASCFVLLKKLKDPVQKKTLIGAAILCMAVGIPFLIPPVNTLIIGLFWFMFKVAVIVYIMIWFRGTFPRFRYDQLMNIGWKYMIPIGIGALIVNALLGMTR